MDVLEGGTLIYKWGSLYPVTQHHIPDKSVPQIGFYFEEF
jgi:hypothetical protein